MSEAKITYDERRVYFDGIPVAEWTAAPRWQQAGFIEMLEEANIVAAEQSVADCHICGELIVNPVCDHCKAFADSHTDDPIATVVEPV